MNHTTQSLKESLYEVFDPRDINCMHEDLWRWVKAAYNNELYLDMGNPSNVLFMEKIFRRMVRYAWQLHQEHHQDFVSEYRDFPALSRERIKQERLHMLQLDDLITWYKGTVRRLSKAETENPLRFFHRFFQYINTKKEWYKILHSWAEYSLSSSSMTDLCGDEVDLQAFELIEGLLESMYLLHLQEHPNPEYLDPVVKLIIEALAPQMIFEIKHLSASSKTAPITELMIVIPDSRQRRLSELEPILDLVTVSDRRLSCSLHISSHIIDKLKSGHLYFSLVCVPQNLIYTHGMLQLPDKPETLSQVIAETQMTFETGHQKAQAFHASSLNQPQRSLGLFMLQQAAEITFRITALTLYGCEKKTHHFKVLKQITKRVAPALNEVLPANTSEERRLLQLLEDAYIHGRYSYEFKVSDEDFQTLYHRVQKLLSLSSEIFNDRVELLCQNEKHRLETSHG